MPEQEMAPHEVHRLIKETTGGSGRIVFGGSDALWYPLEEFRSLSNEAAIYAIGLKLGVQYRGMVSRIVYFGSTATLRERIRAYFKGGHSDRISLLNSRFPNGLVCSFHILPGLALQWRRELEDAAMQAAYRSFGCYPLCNITAIEPRYRDSFSSNIAIKPCENLLFPQNIESLNCGNGVLDTNIPKRFRNGNGRAERPAGGVVVSITIAQHANANDCEDSQLTSSRNSIELLCDSEGSTWITQDNVALWTTEKMIRLIVLCNGLSRVKIRGNSQVISFESVSRKIPRPDTWGEVSLMLARLSTGTFYPPKRTWFKVKCEKELLGQAILEHDFYRGEDKSDVPQTTQRPSISYDSEWQAEVESIRCDSPDDIPPLKIDPFVCPPTASGEASIREQISLLRSAHEYDVREAVERHSFEREMALERQRHKLASQILDERIEARLLKAMKIAEDS